jgi:hypothetical protein
MLAAAGMCTLPPAGRMVNAVAVTSLVLTLCAVGGRAGVKEVDVGSSRHVHSAACREDGQRSGCDQPGVDTLCCGWQGRGILDTGV